MARVIICDDSGDREVALDGDSVSVGRLADSNDVVIANPNVSGHHCRLSVEEGSWFIEDLNSSNGTRVNGRKVGRFELADGDEIQIGGVTVRFLEGDAEASLPVPDIDLGTNLDLDLDLEISLEEEAWLFFPESEGGIEVISGRVTLGRASTNSLQLSALGVSSQHAEIVSVDGEWTFRDLGSTNGSHVNGVTVTECVITHGAHIKLGEEKIVFGLGDQSRAAEFGSSMEEMDDDMGDAMFELSTENAPKGQGLQFVMWLALFAAIGVGGWFMIQSRGGASRSSSQQPLVLAGNLVVEGTSFELADEGEDTIESASDSLDFEETTAYASSGRYSLQVQATGGEGEHVIEFKAPINHISAADRLRIGGWFRTPSYQGCIGLMLTFVDEFGDALGTACVNAPEGLNDFTAVEGIFKPPYGTDSARLSIATHGGYGRAWVDDVFVSRVAVKDRREMQVAGYHIDVSESGLLTVAGVGTELLSDLGLYQMGSRGADSRHDYFIPSSWSRTPEKIQCSGLIVDTADGVGMDLDMAVEATPIGIEVDAKVLKVPSSVVFGMGVQSGESVTAVTSAGVLRLAEVFDLKGVQQLIVGVDIRAARITFKTPTRIVRTKHRPNIVVLHENGSQETGASWSMSIQLNFESELEEALALFRKAEEARNQDDRLGVAVNRFNEIGDRFPFYSDLVKRSKKLATSLQAQGEAFAKRMEATARNIVFFGTYKLNAPTFLAEARAGSDRWQGTAIGERVARSLEDVETEQSKLSGARILALARNHLLRGNDLMVKGKERPVLARGFYNSVVLLVPGTAEAQEAAEHLKRIARLEGEGN